MKKTLSIIGLALLIPALVWAAFSTDTTPYPVYSGILATSTTATAYTATTSDVIGYNTILFTPNVGSLSFTLPASTSYMLPNWLPVAGQRVEMFWYNATTTANQNITIVGNTANGSILSNASTSAVIAPSKGALIEVMRKPNSDLLWTIYPAI